MSEEDFLRCLKNFHGTEKFEELKNVTLFNKKVNLYNFYELAKRKGGSTDAVIITQWRDICIELGLLGRGEDISFEEAYKASQFFCYCFMNFTYPSSGKGCKKRCPRMPRTKIAPNYFRLHNGSKATNSFHYRLLSGSSGKFLAKCRLMDDRPKGAGKYDELDDSHQYENLIWIARNVMKTPKYKFFNDKCPEDCTTFDNQWILPSYDASVPLTYKVQSKVACAAKLAAENSKIAKQSSDESMSRSSDSEYDLVLRECGLSETELAYEYSGKPPSGTDWGNCGAKPGEFRDGFKCPGAPKETTRSYSASRRNSSIGGGTYGRANGVSNSGRTKTPVANTSGIRSKKDLVRNIIHEVAKYLMSGYEIETCLTIILKSLTVVKLPNIPGLCKHMTYINIQFSKELIKTKDFKVQKEILTILDLLCNILSLIIRDSFVEFLKHSYDNTYQQSTLCMESLQVTSCVLFLKINEEFQNNKFKHNDFTLDPNTQKGPQDAVKASKKALSKKAKPKNKNKCNLLRSKQSSESKVTNPDFHSTVNTLHSQLYDNVFGSPKHTVDSNEPNEEDPYITECKRIIREYIKNINKTKNKENVNGNVNNNDYKNKHASNDVYKDDWDSDVFEEKDDSINHLEILSNMFLLIKYLSVISTELWQYDMICGFIDPFMSTAFKEIVDNKAPGYWLWNDFQEALCRLFSSCYFLSQKLEGKMKMGTVMNVYMISAALIGEKSISKILFRKIVQMILSFHIHFDFQMYKSMNGAIKGICEILVQTVTRSITSNMDGDSEDKLVQKDNVSWYTPGSLEHIDSYTNRSDKTQGMDCLFVNTNNPVANPWSSVPRDYAVLKKEPAEYSESSSSDFESIIDYVKLGNESENDGDKKSRSKKSRAGKKGNSKASKESKKDPDQVKRWDPGKEARLNKNYQVLFGPGSFPQASHPTLEESVSFLQDYYRSILGIRAKKGYSGLPVRMDTMLQRDLDSESATRLDSSRSTEKAGSITGDRHNLNDFNEHRFRPNIGNGRHLKRGPAMIDDDIYDTLKEFENTREIACLCIAKMSEYDFCLDIIKCNYNKILECAYNDPSARFLWSVIHKIQSDQSFETHDRVNDYELMCINELE
ncbi:membrance occupation and recognition nexus protein 1 [Theileria orientalis]|uniref:Membrance occupation and recognition nexus protein 1 n=1 Tax=Theileria orientalis TaxID=68886 RepID=A0A976M3K3_THEOR|nr:membrance occupation and recognition nexus protein 1 [Theileria orientalis]